VASERLKQYDALGHRKRVPCSDEFAPKPFGVHSNELVNHEYYYNWSIAWWISRKTGQPVPEAVLLEIERLLARSGDLNYEGLEDTNILFASGHWMFVNSNGMVVRRKVTGVVGTVALPSTTLTYEGTKGCRGEIVVEKPECAYNGLAARQGNNEAESIIDRWEPSSDHFFGTKRDVRQYDARHERTSPSPIGRGRESKETTTKDRRRVMVVETKQRTVGLQAPQVLTGLVTKRDDEDKEDIVRGKPPRKPPDKAMSVPESKKTIKDDRRVPRVVQANYLPHFQRTQKYVSILPAAQNGSTPNINSTPRAAGSLSMSNIETAPSWCSYLRTFVERSGIEEATSAEVQCTSGKESKGGAGPQKERTSLTFVHGQKDALDVLTSSSDPRALAVIDERDSELIHPTAGSIQGETCIAEMYTLGWRVPQPGVEAEGEGVTSQVARTIHCSGKESVSKRRVTHTAPLPAISTRDSPRSPQPMRPHTLYGSSYGPQMAVTLIHPRFHRESRCHRLDGTEFRQNDEAYCSGTKTVCK
jgi:hypothetical protein